MRKPLSPDQMHQLKEWNLTHQSWISVLGGGTKPSVYTLKEGVVCAIASQPFLVPDSQQSFRELALSSAESPACNLGVTAWRWTHSKIECWTPLIKNFFCKVSPKASQRSLWPKQRKQIHPDPWLCILTGIACHKLTAHGLGRWFPCKVPWAKTTPVAFARNNFVGRELEQVPRVWWLILPGGQ